MIAAVLLTQLDELDRVLDAHAETIGVDFAGYRNHAYRVANLCAALSSYDEAAVRKIALAAAFHDIGIWTAGTFDYLAPSQHLACEHLAAAGQSAAAPEIGAMIREHHKLTPCRAHPGWLVEPFRKADLADVSQGLFRFGLPRAFVADLFARWPSAGFHKLLVHLTLQRARTHPLSPLPMLRL